MKKIVLLLSVTLLSLSFFGCEEPADPKPAENPEPKVEEKQENKAVWFTRFVEAQEAARKENKPIFVNFTGSDWCPWCFRLRDEVLVQPAFVDYASKNLVLLMIDFPRRKPQSQELKAMNRELARKYGIRGYPTVLLLNPDGSVIAKTGYRRGGAGPYVSHLQQLLQK